MSDSPEDADVGRKKVRRKVRRRFWKSRRFRAGAIATVFAALGAATVIVAVIRSPSRRTHEFFAGGMKAFSEKDYDEAEVLFRRFLTYESDRHDVHYLLGRTLYEKGKKEEAVAEFHEAARLSPGFDLAWIALADHYRWNGNYRASMEAAQAAIDSPPDPPNAWVALGDVKVLLGDQEEAIEAYKRAIERDPGHADAYLKLGDLYLARQYLGIEDISKGLAEGSYRRAEELARSALLADPANVRAHLWLAKARAGLGDLPEAIAELTRVIEADPTNPEHRLLVARFYTAFGDHEGAEAVLARAMGETPTPEVAIERAKVLAVNIRDAAAAEKVLRDAIGTFPDSASLRIFLAGQLLRREEYAAAREVMDEALERFPGRASVLEADGDLRRSTGDVDGALAAWRASVAANPQNLSARRKLVGDLLPRVLRAIDEGRPPGKEREEIVAHLTFFLDPEKGLNPRDLRARGWMARLAFAEGRFDEARRLLGGDLGAKPTTWDGLKLLGIACLQSNDYHRASQALFAALSHPNCPKAEDDFDLAYTAAYHTGHYSREEEVARMAVLKWPQSAEWRLRLATSLTRNGNLDDALKECDTAKALLAGKQDVRAHLLAARIHQAMGNLTRARNELSDAVLIRRDAETRGALYAFFAATGDEKLAAEGFRALIEDDPDNPQAYLKLGDFLLRGGDPEGALVQYEKARKVAPGSRDAVYRLAELRMSIAANEEAAISVAEDAVEAISKTSADDPYILYFTGKLHLLRGETKEALNALSRYVRENRNDPAGIYYLAIAFRRSGDLESARDQFLAALGLEPGMVEAKLELAALCFTQGVRARFGGDLENARDNFDRVTRLDPDEPDSRTLLSETLARLGFVDRASEQAERAVALNPEDPGALFLSGLFRAQQGDLATAKERFRKLTELQPENYRGWLYLGMARTEGREFDAARESFLQAWKLQPGADDVLEAIARSETVAGRPEEAFRFVEAKRERRPDHAPTYHLLGQMYFRAGRPLDAVAAFRRAFDLDPGSEVSAGMAAAVLADEGEIQSAIDLLAECEDRAKSAAGILTLKGRMLGSLNRRADAETAFRESILADRDYAPPYRELGLLCFATERAEEGERHLRQAAALGLREPLMFFRLGVYCDSTGRFEEAETEYRRVLDLVPEDAPTLNNLALLVARDGSRRAEAVTIAWRARKAAPNDPRVADTVGWVLYLAGQNEDASRILRAAAEAMPDDAEVHYHAGLACFRTYEWEFARPLLKRALELDPDLAGAEEARAKLEKMR